MDKIETIESHLASIEDKFNILKTNTQKAAYCITDSTKQSKALDSVRDEILDLSSIFNFKMDTLQAKFEEVFKSKKSSNKSFQDMKLKLPFWEAKLLQIFVAKAFFVKSQQIIKLEDPSQLESFNIAFRGYMVPFITKAFRVAPVKSVAEFITNLENQKFSFLGKNPLIDEEIMKLIEDMRQDIDRFTMTQEAVDKNFLLSIDTHKSLLYLLKHQKMGLNDALNENNDRKCEIWQNILNKISNTFEKFRQINSLLSFYDDPITAQAFKDEDLVVEISHKYVHTFKFCVKFLIF